MADFEILEEEGTNDVCIQLLRNYATIRDCMNRLMREEERVRDREAENNNKQGRRAKNRAKTEMR